MNLVDLEKMDLEDVSQQLIINAKEKELLKNKALSLALAIEDEETASPYVKGLIKETTAEGEKLAAKEYLMSEVEELICPKCKGKDFTMEASTTVGVSFDVECIIDNTIHVGEFEDVGLPDIKHLEKNTEIVICKNCEEEIEPPEGSWNRS